MVPNEKKLLDLLSNNDVTFFIPPYQRNYEWSEEQCDVFFSDIEKTSNMNSEGSNVEHFFGSITYFQTAAVFGQPNKLVLIDGQQRITTTMLFLVALRDLIEEEDKRTYIDRRFLKNENVSGESEYKIKLKQVETDWISYRNIILNKTIDDSDKNTAVYRNYKYFTNRLVSFVKEGKNIFELIENGLNKFSVITIELQPDKNPWENPQEIFESMNSLGKPLSLADLVRNYLLLGLNAEEQSILYEKYWLSIEKVLPGQISNFIRDYMQAHEGKNYYKSSEANYKLLYRIFKSIFENADTKDLLNDLSQCAIFYSYCIGSNKTNCKEIDNIIDDINKLNVTTSYSFIMELLRARADGKLSDGDIIDILSAFKTYCMRRRILGLTKSESQRFPTYVNWIPTIVKADNKKACMFNLLSKQESGLRLPNDIELERFISTMNFYNFRYCKYYLSLVEEKITKSRPDISDQKLQIEHIMPRTLNDEWKETLGENYEEIHQELVNNIGNLTLIRHNQELGNKPFEEKKTTYEKNAGLQIARTYITDNEKWDREAISARGKWIINFLLKKVLSIPDEMRSVNNYNIEKTGLSFQELQLVGLDIEFIEDPSIKAHVVNDKEVEFEGKYWRLSKLTKELWRRRGKTDLSVAASGALYWAYDGVRISEVM